MCISVCDACAAQITVPEWSTGATPVPLLSRHNGRCFHLAWLNTAAVSQRICHPELECEGYDGSGLSPSYQNQQRTTGVYLGQFDGQIGSSSCSLRRLKPWMKCLNRLLEFGFQVTSMSSLRTVRTWEHSVPVWGVLSDPRGVSESTGPPAQLRSAQIPGGLWFKGDTSDAERHDRCSWEVWAWHHSQVSHEGTLPYV